MLLEIKTTARGNGSQRTPSEDTRMLDAATLQSHESDRSTSPSPPHTDFAPERGHTAKLLIARALPLCPGGESRTSFGVGQLRRRIDQASTKPEARSSSRSHAGLRLPSKRLVDAGAGGGRVRGKCVDCKAAAALGLSTPRSTTSIYATDSNTPTHSSQCLLADTGLLLLLYLLDCGFSTEAAYDAGVRAYDVRESVSDVLLLSLGKVSTPFHSIGFDRLTMPANAKSHSASPPLSTRKMH